MRQPGFLAVSSATLAVTIATSGQAAQERGMDLPALVARLDLTEAGARRWLAQLGVNGDGASAERLMAVSVTGAPLLVREGGSSAVRIDPELDTLLLRPDMAVVLVHNHPANVGLSSNDLRQLTKPGIAAIVAIGHDGSVFIASAGPRLDRELFPEEQYARATAEVMKRLRAEWPSGRVTVAVSDAHFSHLVTLALQRAGIVQYWFKLRGTGRESFEKARVAFAQVVEGAAGRLRRDR
jgi:hypothetical protein